MLRENKKVRSNATIKGESIKKRGFIWGGRNIFMSKFHFEATQ